MKQFFLLMNFAGILMLAGCSKDAPTGTPPFEPPPTLSGTWVGTVSGNSMGMQLNDLHDGTISGTGSFYGWSVLVNGTTKYPKLEFTFTTPGIMPAHFEGSLVEKDSMVGLFNYTGLSNEATFLHRVK